ncbi:hypothetical protein B0A49_06644 [Cryomyces minteri]|uniref:Erythromycin biosynthesis protein CIII-like C-terminal domain-containing protein n=1 Tax=Cryomyces minteri TaxID=331657 RepID=A0A4U0X3Q1_9PEZI|nr:hypothetical protein B0A49_06644 [Cryomyces minteri]
MMTWQGLGEVINKFRHETLNLEPIKFLAAGPKPVYIGFGFIVVDDPDAMTKLIFNAIRLASVRALVSKGWGGLGAHEVGKPDEVFMLGNIPHDWLFEHLSAVVPHGGAGTTAAGIAAGKPSVIVPFFGDQHFWGSVIARASAGPAPIAYKDLTAELLAEQLRIALSPEALTKARELGARMSLEEGAETGALSFHSGLNTALHCSVVPNVVGIGSAKDDGATALLKGMGKGLEGLVLKPGAAIFGVPADAIKGVYKELQKVDDERLAEHITSSRMAQGREEAGAISHAGEAAIVERWTIVKSGLFHGPRSITLTHSASHPPMTKMHGALPRLGCEHNVGERDNQIHLHSYDGELETAVGLDG